MKRRNFLFVSLVLSLALGHAASLVNASPKTVKLLTVGNSFSQNATHYLGDIATAAGNKLVQHSANIGGSTMAQHLEKAEKYEKDPLDPSGLYSTKKSLQEELKAEEYDFITIQQASIKSHDINNYRPSAAQLLAYIRKYASPKSEVVIHQTWAYRCDDRRFTPTNTAPGEPLTQEAMYQGLTAAYHTIATELKLRVIPVGDAFHLADNDPKWGYRPDTNFNAKTAKQGALPDQTHSLHRGRYWSSKNGKDTLTFDGHHAGVAGEYLGACVWYEFLFQDNVVGNKFIPPGLDPAYAHFLQETAHRAIEAEKARSK